MYFKIEDMPQAEIAKKSSMSFKIFSNAWLVKIWPKTAQQERWFALSLLLSILLIFIGSDLISIWQNRRMMTKAEIKLAQLQEQQTHFELNVSPFRVFLTSYFIHSQWANMRAFEQLLYHWVAEQLSLRINAVYKSGDGISWQIEGAVERYQDIVKLEAMAQSLGWKSEVIWQNNDHLNVSNGQSIVIIVTPMKIDLPLLTLRQDHDAN